MESPHAVEEARGLAIPTQTTSHQVIPGAYVDSSPMIVSEEPALAPVNPPW